MCFSLDNRKKSRRMWTGMLNVGKKNFSQPKALCLERKLSFLHEADIVKPSGSEKVEFAVKQIFAKGNSQPALLEIEGR